MCRLLGSVSRAPVTVDEVLGDGRAAFLELACKHGDGWGHAFSEHPEHVEVHKAPDSARENPAFASLASGRAARAALTHLRWATLGLGLSLENTHPFTDGRIAFGHNGSIDPPEALDQLISPHLAGQRHGTTDSERYFLALLSRLAEQDEVEALVSTLADVASLPGGAKSLNCMLLTPKALYAVCSYDPASYDEPDYYPLLYRADAETVVVASTGWTDSAGWTTLSNGQMLVVDRETLATTVVAVATPVAAGAGAR